MKKILFAMLVVSSTASFAMKTVDLSQHSYMCNGVLLTKNTAESTLVANCKGAKVRAASTVTGGGANRAAGGGGNSFNIGDTTDDTSDIALERVKFYTDNGTYMKCYYKNGNMVKCEANKTKKPVTASN